MKVLSNIVISFLTCEFEMLFASFNLGVGWGIASLYLLLMNHGQLLVVKAAH
jgi:hypothetical protein